MAQQTAIEYLIKGIKEQYLLTPEMWKMIRPIIEQAKQMEKEQIIDAMLYALDEDGHTGEWKLNFVKNYYNQILNQEK